MLPPLEEVPEHVPPFATARKRSLVKNFLQSSQTVRGERALKKKSVQHRFRESGEVDGWVLAKGVLRAVNRDVEEACGFFLKCSGLSAGQEAAAYAMQKLYERSVGGRTFACGCEVRFQYYEHSSSAAQYLTPTPNPFAAFAELSSDTIATVLFTAWCDPLQRRYETGKQTVHAR